LVESYVMLLWGGVSLMLPVKVTCRDGHLSRPTQREWWVEMPDEANIGLKKIKAFMNILSLF